MTITKERIDMGEAAIRAVVAARKAMIADEFSEQAVRQMENAEDELTTWLVLDGDNLIAAARLGLDPAAEITRLRGEVERLRGALEKTAIALERCPKVETGAGGQTIEACLGRKRFVSVPYSVYGDIREALTPPTPEAKP